MHTCIMICSIAATVDVLKIIILSWTFIFHTPIKHLIQAFVSFANLKDL